MIVNLMNVRLSFPALWNAEPVSKDVGAKLKFGAQFLLPPDHPDLAPLQAAIAAVIKEEWGSKAVAVTAEIKSGGSDRTCLRDGDGKPAYEGYPGNFYLSAKSKGRPLVIDQNRNPLTQADGKPYSGCYVNARVDIFGYKDPRNGISAQLMGVQFIGDGEVFGGGRAADPTDFPVVSVAAEEVDALM